MAGGYHPECCYGKGAWGPMGSTHILPILVEFGIGAVLIAAGIGCGLASGCLDLKQAQDRRLIAVFAAGFAGLLIFYFLFTFWLPFIPHEVVAP